VRVVPDDRLRRTLDQVGEPGVRKSVSERGEGRRREDDVANEAKPDEQDVQGSTVASSINMIGMSSLMG
jgi:hypothetical protein